MDIAVNVIHVIACFFLIVVVLLQTGKGADIGAVFGGSSQTVFGSGGAANLLTRLTTYTAIIFMITSLFLTWVSTRSLTVSVADDVPFEPPPLTAPASPPAAPAAAVDTSAVADPVTGEEPAPEKLSAAGTADVEEEETAEAVADDTGAALEAAGTDSVEQVEEQMEAEDGATGDAGKDPSSE